MIHSWLGFPLKNSLVQGDTDKVTYGHAASWFADGDSGWINPPRHAGQNHRKSEVNRRPSTGSRNRDIEFIDGHLVVVGTDKSCISAK